MLGRRGTAVLLAVGVLTVLGGCGPLGGAPKNGAGSAARASGNPGSWVVVSQGAGTPSPTVGSGKYRSGGILPSLPVVPTATMTVSPGASATCTPVQRTSPLAGLTVQPGAGTAVVTWYHADDPALIEYRLTAIPQDVTGGSQPALTWQSIAPGQGCGLRTATVTGLNRSAPYIFSLDAVTTNYNADGNRTATVARSQVVYTS